MLKNIILSTLFVFAFTASATVPYMTRGDYVHWSEAKKEEFHIKVMELMVQLESRYQRETAMHGYSEERYQRYVQVLKTLQSQLLISEAYADDGAVAEQTDSDEFISIQRDILTHRNKQRNIDWNGMAVGFKVLSTRSSQNGEGNCIFGGWISQVRKVRDKNGNVRSVCAHPNFVGGAPGKVTMENVNYPDNAQGACSKTDRRNIQCNPLIFGYKNAAKKELFCVPTSRNAENSSFQCMQQALDVTERVGVDSRQKRMQDLKERYASSNNAVDVFNTVFMFNYKTCVCGEPQNNFNKEYHNYMRPSENAKTTDRYRTCYGLMNMMKETVNECALPIGTNAGIFTAFDEFLKEKHRLTSDPAGPVADAWYKEFITTGLKTSRPAVEAYNQICPDKLDVPSDPTPETPAVTIETPAKEYVCKAECQFPQSGAAATATPGTTTTPAAASPGASSASSLSCKYIVNEKDKEEKIEGAKPEKEPATKEDKFVMVKHEKLPAEGVRCEIQWPEEATAEATQPDPKITVSISNKGDTHYDVKAVTENDQGYEIEWKVEDPDGAKPEEGWKSATATAGSSTPAIRGLGGDSTPASAPAPSSDETPPADDPATDNSATTTASAASSAESGPKGPKDIKQKRAQKDYKVCADLVKGDKRVTGNCVTIDKITPPTVAPAAAPAGNFMPNNQGAPQTPIRGSSDTSAVGIR